MVRRLARSFRFTRSLEQFNQPHKIEGCLARFLKCEEACLPRLDRIGLAVKCAKSPTLGVLDGVAALQFAHLPGRKLKSYDGANIGHQK